MHQQSVPLAQFWAGYKLAFTGLATQRKMNKISGFVPDCNALLTDHAGRLFTAYESTKINLDGLSSWQSGSKLP